jgi:hypothetical protein
MRSALRRLAAVRPKQQPGSPRNRPHHSSKSRSGNSRYGRSILLLLSQERSVAVPIRLECHSVPFGDPFANVGVIVLIEFDQINLLPVDSVMLENAQPLHLGITR